MTKYTPNHIHSHYLNFIDEVLHEFIIIENRIIKDEDYLLTSDDCYQMLREAFTNLKNIKLEKYKL